MIAFQVTLGAILTVIFIASADKLAAAFVPASVRETSLTYVRISSVEALSSAMQVAAACSTRALDHPDVPLLISSTDFIVNIILDLLIISKFHVGPSTWTPTVNSQALVRMACDLTSAVCGLLYFLYIATKLQGESRGLGQSARPSIASLKILARPAIYTFAESALRNSIYLWLISGIVSMGSDYATAWGVFNTIRWGIVMVPVQALEASTLTFVGHAWGQWRAQVGPEVKRPKASRRDLLGKPLSSILLIRLLNYISHYAPGIHIFMHRPRSRSPLLHLSLPLGNQKFCILPLRVRFRSLNNPDYVEGRYLQLNSLTDSPNQNLPLLTSIIPYQY
jgi:hypothetical protein